MIGGPGSSSLSLLSGASATSPKFCVELGSPTLRLFLRNTGNSSSKLALDVLYTQFDGTTASSQIASFTGSAAWQPSPVTYYYANMLALFSGTGTTDIALRLRPLDNTGAWSIDDLYVDPFRKS